MNYLTKHISKDSQDKPDGWIKSEFWGVINMNDFQSYIDDGWEEMLFEQNSNYIDEELQTMDKFLRLDPSDSKHISKFFLRKENQNAKYN
jgi:hypothetical protein